MKKISILVLLAFVAVACVACIGSGENSTLKAQGKNFFPILAGIDLHGKQRVLPSAFDGELNLVLVAFEREQQKDVDTWIAKLDELQQLSPGLKFFEVPLIYRVNMPYRFWINNGMRAGIADDTARSRTITVYTDREQFLALMNMNKEEIYALLIDGNGKILWKVAGVADDENIAQLKSLLNKGQ